MEVIFLGTSGMQPTKERNLQSMLIRHKEENILIDCGEGTQRQLRIANLKPTKITKILFSHMHVDHTLGLGGLVRYLDANEYSGVLEIYGPKGLKDTCKCLITGLPGRPKFKIKIKETKEGKVFDSKHLEVYCKKLKHSIECLGYSIKEKNRLKINLRYLSKFGLKEHPLLGKLQQGKDIVWKGKKITVDKGTTKIKGKKVSVVLDSTYCKNAVLLSQDSDLLVCESTFSDKEKDKARDYKHLTSEMAARIALESNSKKLILTHFSQRHKSTSVLCREAKKIFKKVSCANDFDVVKV